MNNKYHMYFKKESAELCSEAGGRAKPARVAHTTAVSAHVRAQTCSVTVSGMALCRERVRKAEEKAQVAGFACLFRLQTVSRVCFSSLGSVTLCTCGPMLVARVGVVRFPQV